MARKLDNHLRTQRHRMGLRQDHAGFLIGADGSALCHYERFKRQPTLETALACQVVYGRPVHELFPGLYQKVEKQVHRRAKVLHRIVEAREGRKFKQARLRAIRGIYDRSTTSARENKCKGGNRTPSAS